MPSVLVVAFDFPPAATVGVHRTLRMVKYLPRHGWRSAVLTGQPEARGGRRDESLLDQVPRDTTVVRTGLLQPEEIIKNWLRLGRQMPPAARDPAAPQPAGHDPATPPATPPLRRVLADLLFATPDSQAGWLWTAVRAGARLARQQQVDVIYATGPPFTAHLVAQRVARRVGRPLVLDFRDPWSRCPWGPRKPYPLSQRRLGRLEAACVHSAAAVVLNTARLAEEFRRFYRQVPAERFSSIPNGYDPDWATRIATLATRASLPRAPGEPPVLLHPGSLYRRRDPRPVLEAVARLAQAGRPIKFLQLGPCDPEFHAAELAQRLGISSLFEVHPPVPHGDVLARMALAELFLIVQPDTDLQVPGKLFEMLLFHKPVVALAETGETADIIQRFRLGLVAPPTDAEAISQALAGALDRLQQPENADDWSAAMAQFDGARLAGDLASLFNRVAPARH